MATNGRYDVIIMGTGAGGGTLLHRLATTGKKILVLERGDFVPRERDNWDSRAVNVQAKYNTKETWYDKDGKPLHPIAPRPSIFGYDTPHVPSDPLWPLRQADVGGLRPSRRGGAARRSARSALPVSALHEPDPASARPLTPA